MGLPSRWARSAVNTASWMAPVYARQGAGLQKHVRPTKAFPGRSEALAGELREFDVDRLIATFARGHAKGSSFAAELVDR
eukprot:7565623-Alexandrium_andersonii.AAC.1